MEHPEMGVKNLEPYRHMCWIYILWHCRFSMDFPIYKGMFLRICSKKPSFLGDVSIFTGPRKPTSFPTVGPKELISIGIAIRPWRYRPVAAICTMVKLHGKKEYGHLTMMGNPSDDCINPYKWIQMVVFFAGAMSLINTPSNMTAATNGYKLQMVVK